MWVHVDRYAMRSCEGVIERIFRGCSWGTARVKRERIARVYVLSCYVCARALDSFFSRGLRLCGSTWLRRFPCAYSAPH